MSRRINRIAAVLMLGGHAAIASEDGISISVPLPQLTTQSSAATLYCSEAVYAHLGGQDGGKLGDGGALPAHVDAHVFNDLKKPLVRLRLEFGTTSLGVAIAGRQGEFDRAFHYQVLDDSPEGFLAVLDRSRDGGVVEVLALNRAKGTAILTHVQASFADTHPSSSQSFFICSPVP